MQDEDAEGAAVAAVPSGIVTFLFTDVEGSTRLWAEDRAAMAASLKVHDQIVRQASESRGGYVFTTAGDSFAVAFGRASDAVAAALAAQAALTAQAWPGPVLRVRMGLHLGEAEERGGDYFGPVVNTTARIEAAGHGGQVLLTELVRQAAEVPAHDLGSHHLRDVAEPIHIWQLGEEEFPALRVMDPWLTNLPTAPTSLVGRSEDLRTVREALRLSRLVTLTAAGGTGKTRLAIAAGEEELPHRPDGVWFVDLTPVNENRLVGAAVASGLGLNLLVGDPIRQVVDFVAGKDVLLIVDNCEHLIDGVAELAERFLDRSGRAALLATSRERLDVDGERVVQVSPLSFDDDDSTAVELFAQRAAMVSPSFSLTDKIRPLVAQLCRRLDGMPLAIELAAARCAVLTPAELLAGIEDRFALLGVGRRRQRQRTLEATLDWSYELLDEDEQALLRALGAFVGSFDLAAVAAVADVGQMIAVDLLGSLVARSLVVHEDVGGRSRYRLFETTSAYAAQRLADCGEAAEVRDRHLDYLVGLSGRHGMHMWADLAAVDPLGADRANVTSAFDWAAARNRWTTAAELLLGSFTVYHTHAAEGIDLVDRCVAHLDDDDNDLAMRLACNQWWLHATVGDWKRSSEVMQRLRHSPTPLHRLHGQCLLSILAGPSDHSAGARLVDHAFDLLDSLPSGPDAVEAATVCEGALAFAATLNLEPRVAIGHARAVHRLSAEAGTTSALAVQVSYCEAVALLMVGDPSAALQAVDRYDEFRSSLWSGDEIRALAYAAAGDVERARAAARAHARIAATGQVSLQASDSLLVLAALAVASDNPAIAAGLLLNLGICRGPATQGYARHLADRLGLATKFELAQAGRRQAFASTTGNAADLLALRTEMDRLGWH